MQKQRLDKIEAIIKELEYGIERLKTMKESHEQLSPFASYEGEFRIVPSGFGSFGQTQLMTKNPAVRDFLKDEATAQLTTLNIELNSLLEIIAKHVLD
jgi:hypothetical protein